MTYTPGLYAWPEACYTLQKAIEEDYELAMKLWQENVDTTQETK